MFVGDGDQLIKIKNLISESNLENDIRIINGEKNPFPIIKKSDLFILSSKFEGLPNVILEALSLNKFIISSNCPTGPAEILDNGKGGLLFNVGNYKELAKQIIYFKKNKNICKAKLKYARKRLFRFDYKLNLNKYKRIISKLIV